MAEEMGMRMIQMIHDYWEPPSAHEQEQNQRPPDSTPGRGCGPSIALQRVLGGDASQITLDTTPHRARNLKAFQLE